MNLGIGKQTPAPLAHADLAVFTQAPRGAQKLDTGCAERFLRLSFLPQAMNHPTSLPQESPLTPYSG